MGPARAAAVRLNQVFEGAWSFRILACEVRALEVLVLGELSAGGTVRQQFGWAPTKGGAGDQTGVGKGLKQAAQDALLACAGAFDGPGREPGDQGPVTEPASAALGGDRSFVPLSEQQLSAIYSLARFRGLSEEGVGKLTRERFGEEPPRLDALQAAQAISDLVIRPQKANSAPPAKTA